MTLYKYLPPERVDVLEKLQIRFSPALSVNDAFELRPVVKGWASEEAARKILVPKVASSFHAADTPEKMLQMAITDHPEAEARFRATMRIIGAEQWFRLMKSVAEQNFEKEAAKVHAVVEQNWETISAPFMQRLRTELGILSLSEDSRHPVMWGNYADSSLGFVVGFDERHSWFDQRRSENDDFCHLRKVAYIEENPRYFSELTADDVCYSKLEAWSYEKEWRMVFPLYLGIDTKTSDKFGQPVIVFPFPADCVKEVVIGSRATDELSQKIREACKKLSNSLAPSRGTR